MEMTSVAGLSSAMSQAQVGDAVAILVLKKAIEMQAQSAAQLLQALPSATANPPHLGSKVDVRA